jgi:hypothetical protein
LQAAVGTAPKVIELLAQFKTFIAGLFHAGLISEETQDATFAKANSIVSLHLSGDPPPHWLVEPDPE